MDDHTAFIQANLHSPVVRINVGARATTYHLEDGSTHKLNARGMQRLGDFITREGFRIRLSAELARRLGEEPPRTGMAAA